MRTKFAMLAALAGLGLAIAGEAIADADNLSCISDDSPVERRVIRDCETNRFPRHAKPAPDAPFLMNQTLVKTAAGWRIANILPIPLPPAAPVPAK